MILTASDRSSLIRLAASLPKGSDERRAILGGLKTSSSLRDRAIAAAKEYGKVRGVRTLQSVGSNRFPLRAIVEAPDGWKTLLIQGEGMKILKVEDWDSKAQAVVAFRKG